MKKTKKYALIGIGVFLALSIAASIYIWNVYLPQKRLQEQYTSAQELLKNKKYEEAQSAFEKLGQYEDSKEMISEVQYQNANDLYGQKKFQDAYDIFLKLENYKDSSSLCSQCMMGKAEEFMNEKKFEEALQVISTVKSDVDGVSELTAKCKYLQAIDWFENKKFKEAAAAFTQNLDYESSKDYLYQCAQKLLKNKDYKLAGEIWKGIVDYKDSKKLYDKSRELQKYAKYKKKNLYEDYNLKAVSVKKSEKLLRQYLYLK